MHWINQHGRVRHQPIAAALMLHHVLMTETWARLLQLQQDQTGGMWICKPKYGFHTSKYRITIGSWIMHKLLTPWTYLQREAQTHHIRFARILGDLLVLTSKCRVTRAQKHGLWSWRITVCFLYMTSEWLDIKSKCSMGEGRERY